MRPQGRLLCIYKYDEGRFVEDTSWTATSSLFFFLLLILFFLLFLLILLPSFSSCSLPSVLGQTPGGVSTSLRSGRKRLRPGLKQSLSLNSRLSLVYPRMNEGARKPKDRETEECTRECVCDGRTVATESSKYA